MKQQNALAGILLVLAAQACFATLDTTTKFVTLSVPVLVAMWCRYLFQVVTTTAIVLPLRGRAVLRTAHPRYQALRGLLLLTCSLLAMLSLTYLPVAEFTAIIMMTPLLITLLASKRMHEKVSLTRWALVGGGFLGTLIIIRPDSHLFGWFMVLPLILVVTSAAYQMLTGHMARLESSVTMHFYTGWIGFLLLSLLLPWVWVTPQSASQWTGLLIMGLASSAGHFLLIQAYTRATAATLTPFLYAQIGFATLGGWLVFAYVPDGWSILGMLMITGFGAASVWLSVRESRAPMEPLSD